MSYHKENLKEQIVEIAWDICKTESWQKVNMRKVAKEAKVSTTAFYRNKATTNTNYEIIIYHIVVKQSIRCRNFLLSKN